MNTKGAGAEGARPLCGAAEGRPSCFGIFGILIVYFLSIFGVLGVQICIFRVFFVY